MPESLTQKTSNFLSLKMNYSKPVVNNKPIITPENLEQCKNRKIHYYTHFSKFAKANDTFDVY